MGDFNYRVIDWTDSSRNVGEDHVASLFLECIRDTYLCQHVTEPTRNRENNEPSTLDLVLTNKENMVNNLSYWAKVTIWYYHLSIYVLHPVNQKLVLKRSTVLKVIIQL